MESNFTQIPFGSIRTLQFFRDEEVIWIIRTGRRNQYIVVHDDAHELTTGDTEVLTLQQIREKYKIDILTKDFYHD